MSGFENYDQNIEPIGTKFDVVDPRTGAHNTDMECEMIRTFDNGTNLARDQSAYFPATSVIQQEAVNS